MADEYLIKGDTLSSVADAIRAKTGKTGAIAVEDMASEIGGITTKTDPVLQEKTITVNGEYTADTGYDGLKKVTVNVADIPAKVQEKSVIPKAMEQSVIPDSGYEGLSKVTVGAVQTETKTITANGDYLPDNTNTFFSSVSVNVPIPEDYIVPTDTKVITSNGVYDITAYASVSVAVSVEEYDGSVTVSSGEFTDLTGTSWKINSIECTAGYGIFNVDNLQNDDVEGCSQLGIGYEYSFESGWGAQANSVWGYNTENFMVYGYEVGNIITITGGSDVTNADLIAWLKANATQQ